jgi:phytoene desaturase
MKSIVIGSGFGGIAAALRLKAKNHDVLLIEKQNDLGGRARVLKKWFHVRWWTNSNYSAVLIR